MAPPVFSCPDDEDELARQINTLLKDQTLYDRLSAAGKARYTRSFPGFADGFRICRPVAKRDPGQWSKRIGMSTSGNNITIIFQLVDITGQYLADPGVCRYHTRR